MYCIKVELGKERIRVRGVGSGFLPTYTPYVRNRSGEGKTARQLIVPGYVFTLVRTRYAIQVPDEEWKVIEALSDSKMSTVRDGQIVDGPLAALTPYIRQIGEDAVQIRAELLGEERQYRLPVKNAETEEKAMAEKKDYSEEQTQEALNRAAEIGIHKTGAEMNIPWQTIQGWARKAGKLTEVSKQPGKKTKAGRKAAAKDGKTDEGAGTDASRVGKEQTEAAGAEASAEAGGLTDENASPLEVENAVLREQVAALTEQVARLKRALQELL